MRPTEHVLDMFAVPADIESVPGGQGCSVRAGDLVLSPGRDPGVQDAISPRLARLAADLDTRPGRHRQDLRIAMPVPARDGSWVVEGWSATRFEPGARPLTDLAATRAVGAVLHAELARAVPERPAVQRAPRGRRAEAERVAFGEHPAPSRGEGAALLRALTDHRDDTPLGPDQLVHGSLAGTVLLDADGAPVVTGVVPSWRPVLWAEAGCVLDSVLHLDAHPDVLTGWTEGAAGQALVRAAIVRLISGDAEDLPALERALAPLLASIRS